MHVLLNKHCMRTTYNIYRTAFHQVANGVVQKVDTMVTSLDTFSDALAVSREVVPTSPSTSSSPSSISTFPNLANIKALPSLDQADFPNLPYWFEDPWKLRRSGTPKTEDDASDDLMALETDELQAPDTKTKSSKKKDATLSCFLEDKDGKTLSRGKKKEIFTMVRAYWQSLFENGRAPGVSSAVNLETKLHFRYLMESNFECLRYCNSHWKVERIWISYYPSWLRGALKRAEEERNAAETAVIVIDDDENEGGDKTGEDNSKGKNKTAKRS